jgi:hypothetical protein
MLQWRCQRHCFLIKNKDCCTLLFFCAVIFLFARLRQLLFWSVEQLLVLLWLGYYERTTADYRASIILSTAEMQYHHGAL